nr:hypothetical protein [Niveispirillum sp.]
MGTGITLFHQSQKPDFFQMAKLFSYSPFRQAAVVSNPTQARKNIAAIVISKAA